MQPSTVQNMVLQARDYRMMGMDGSDGRNPMVSGSLPSLDTELLVREARPGKRQKTHILSIQVSHEALSILICLNLLAALTESFSLTMEKRK